MERPQGYKFAVHPAPYGDIYGHVLDLDSVGLIFGAWRRSWPLMGSSNHLCPGGGRWHDSWCSRCVSLSPFTTTLTEPRSSLEVGRPTGRNPCLGCGSSILSVFGLFTSTASKPKGGSHGRKEKALPWAAQPIATETTQQVLGSARTAETGTNQQERSVRLRLFLGGRRRDFWRLPVREHGGLVIAAGHTEIPPYDESCSQPEPAIPEAVAGVWNTEQVRASSGSDSSCSGNATTPPRAWPRAIDNRQPVPLGDVDPQRRQLQPRPSQRPTTTRARLTAAGLWEKSPRRSWRIAPFLLCRTHHQQLPGGAGQPPLLLRHGPAEFAGFTPFPGSAFLLAARGLEAVRLVGAGTACCAALNTPDPPLSRLVNPVSTR